MQCATVHAFGTAMKLAICCYQAPSQVLRFGGAKYILRRLDFRLYYMFKTNFPGDNTIWGVQKYLRGHMHKNTCVALPPNVPSGYWRECYDNRSDV